MTRRALLAAGAGIAAAGCTGGGPTEPTPSSSPDPDSAALQAAISRERDLLAGYAAAAAADPATADLLAEAATRHEVHLSRLMGVPAAAYSPPTASAGPSAAASPTPVAPPPTPADLRRAERSAASAGLAAVPRAADPALARLLASIAASESASAAVTR